MLIPILSKNDVATLYKNIGENLSKYNEQYDPFGLLGNCRFVQDTEIPENLDALCIYDSSLSKGELDAKNALVVYLAVKNITPYQARDERILCAISHIFLSKFALFRHDISDENKEDKVSKHFFSRGSGARGIERLNVFGRLWWRAFFVDRCKGKHDLEELLNTLCIDTDFRQSLMERPEIGKIPELSLAVLLCKRRFEMENPGSVRVTPLECNREQCRNDQQLRRSSIRQCS